jgi:protease I
MTHPLLPQRPLDGIRILVLVGDDYEDLELWYPKLRIEEAGGHVVLAGSLQGRTYSGKHGYPCTSDAMIADMEAADFHGIVIPGGWMPDKLRSPPAASSWRRSATGAGSRFRRASTAGFASPAARASRMIS